VAKGSHETLDLGLRGAAPLTELLDVEILDGDNDIKMERSFTAGAAVVIAAATVLTVQAAVLMVQEIDLTVDAGRLTGAATALTVQAADLSIDAGGLTAGTVILTVHEIVLDIEAAVLIVSVAVLIVDVIVRTAGETVDVARETVVARRARGDSFHDVADCRHEKPRQFCDNARARRGVIHSLAVEVHVHGIVVRSFVFDFESGAAAGRSSDALD
jgi:hypothetical protein